MRKLRQNQRTIQSPTINTLPSARKNVLPLVTVVLPPASRTKGLSRSSQRATRSLATHRRRTSFLPLEERRDVRKLISRRRIRSRWMASTTLHLTLAIVAAAAADVAVEAEVRVEAIVAIVEGVEAAVVVAKGAAKVVASSEAAVEAIEALPGATSTPTTRVPSRRSGHKSRQPPITFDSLGLTMRSLLALTNTVHNLFLAKMD